MFTPKMISNEFGSAWCNPALFYSYARALRFELALGEHPIDRFLSAHQRALAVTERAFQDADDLHLSVKIYLKAETPGVAPLLRTFRGLQECGLPLPHRESIEVSQAAWDHERWQCIMSIPIRRCHVSRVIWAAVGHDIGIEPRLPAAVYIVSPSVGILAHPYDDRGMDVIGPNTTRLKDLFETHRTWLLDHDLATMQRCFGGPDAASRGAEG
jgi:hypothetical protein